MAMLVSVVDSPHPMSLDLYQHWHGQQDPQDPEFYDWDETNTKLYFERYRNQDRLRETWLALLRGRYPDVFAPNESSNALPLRDQALVFIGRERFCQRALLETHLGVSAARVSAIKDELLKEGLLDQKEVTVGPGRPVQLYLLTDTGLKFTRGMGHKFQPAPALDSAAIKERVLHQRIASIYQKAQGVRAVLRAYSDPPPASISTPLGTIMPDLEVAYGDGKLFIEIESGEYHYNSLADKIDKYLASAIPQVLIITAESKAPTANQIEQWCDTRQHKLPAGIKAYSALKVYVTSLDQIQRAGVKGNIWQIFQVGEAL